MRLCPKCGKRSEEARCPDDGTATLVFAANPDSRLQMGTEVNGRYRIREMIGQGGFGAVYKATSIATDQDCAIKLLAVSLDNDDSDMIQRFFAEAQITASLKHPNTIRVFDFGQTEGGALYIAMELLAGQPLNELLRRRLQEGRVLTEDETITIGAQSLRSLAEAHQANLVHRDLKPHNIFLNEVDGDDTVVKVLDFGIAKKLGSNLTGTGKAFGTPTYMSPEQAQNKPIDRRSDLYSLGCVLYQCVAGRPPFEGDNPLAVLLSHVTETPADLRAGARTPVSEAFVRVIEKATAKDANDRFNTAIEMRQALEACRGANLTEGALRVPTGAALLPMASAAQDGVDEKTSAYDAPKPAEDMRTSAYAAPHAPGARKGTGGATPLTGAAAAVSIAGVAPPADNPTFGFFSKSPEATLPPNPPQPSAATSSAAPQQATKWLIGLAVLAVLACALAAGLWWTGRGETAADATGQPAATQAAVAAAKQEAPVPGAAAPSAVVPTAAGAGQAAAVAPPLAEVAVLLTSEPSGAQVQVDGKVLGTTPVPLKIAGNNKVTARLSLASHADLEVEVGRDDAPRKSVQLSASAAQPPAGNGSLSGTAATKKAAKSPRTGVQPHGHEPADKTRSKSALEERL